MRQGQREGPKGAIDSKMTELRPRDVPHLLEWHSCYCVGLADTCQDARVKHLLRLLAADLAIEAVTVRRQWKEHDVAELGGANAGRGSRSSVDISV
jgi:hypothetical protein